MRLARPQVMRFPVALALLLAAVPCPGQENEACLECHGKPGLSVAHEGRQLSLFVDAQRLASSQHGDLPCVACHQELEEVETWPHTASLARVDCGVCHEADDPPIAAYWGSRHGEEVQAGDRDAPLCQDCHGSHAIVKLDSEDPASSISPFNIPRMCGQCHDENGIERTHDLSQEHVLERYKDSIHAAGLFKKGLLHTAVCTSCHTGHNVLSHTDPRSTIHQDNVAATCMQCHGLIEQVHRTVIAGVLWEREGVVPICVECHEPHEARKVYYDSQLSNRECLDCHGDPEQVAERWYVDSLGWLRMSPAGPDTITSVHARHGVTCAQCHTGVTPNDPGLSPGRRACATIEKKVDCSVCHEGQVKAYERGRHGLLRLQRGDAAAPYCTDCHGTHETLEHLVPEGAPPQIAAAIRKSPTYSRNVPDLCARCHRDGAPAAMRYFGPESQIIERYSMSIHGTGLINSGLTVTATCTDCHSAHMELPKSDPASSVSKEHIAATCGKCHDGIYEQYAQSIHSVSGNPGYEARRTRGMPELPHCDDCHTAHAVKRTDAKDFRLGIMDQCGKCHQDVTKTYFDTYHGKASKLGDSTRAKCYDCHGAHGILAPEDIHSPLSRTNIVATCGKCHEGSHRQFAGYLTHATHHDPDKYPALYYTFWGMTTLLIGVFAFFGLHTIAWLPRSWKLRHEYKTTYGAVPARHRQFVRFTRAQRQMHVVMIVTFLGVAITGMMLKFSYTGWAQALGSVLGGTNGAGMIHRICAFSMLVLFVGHVVSIFVKYWKSGKGLKAWFLGPDSLVPVWRDVREFWATVRWFVGRGPRPEYGRWTYWEKFDYLAVFWGVAIIGSTGLVLWFPESFTRFLPGQAINVATIIHSDEALLATGFIFTIHFFNTHFRPEKFPMDTVIFTGKMSIEELAHDKPALYRSMVESGELENHLRPAASPAFMRAARIFGFSALTVGFLVVGLIIYAMVFAYR